ncbi:hypothetical protein Salmuc_00574 [Salipiger mucosus DSM 16094]|uniref:Uncharacterized protein n=1 Tax=Salipiger mucosus DSM 16094 TaxID=1123237 RepID=S9QZE4_9RHOB|nr:hypothetical protein Salmuc_00574 [Salipiger mucosus DSM 16094]
MTRATATVTTEPVTILLRHVGVSCPFFERARSLAETSGQSSPVNVLGWTCSVPVPHTASEMCRH